MTREDLGSFIADFVQVGYMEAVRAYDPPQDLLKGSEVKRWLKFMHIDEEKFLLLVKKGKITRERKGKSKNSPLYYSKRQIKEQIAKNKLNGIKI
jgi:hypothetical protein